jgi:hypothetical protein
VFYPPRFPFSDGYILQINVTLNVTLGYLASSTNVTFGIQRSDGNVTLPGQSSMV